MSVLLDEETVVLEGLDFEVPCVFNNEPAHTAEFALICLRCGYVSMTCGRHLAWLKEKIRLLGPDSVVECLHCHESAPTFNEIVRVVKI